MPCDDLRRGAERSLASMGYSTPRSGRADDGDSRHRGLTCPVDPSRKQDALRSLRWRRLPSRSSRSPRVGPAFRRSVPETTVNLDQWATNAPAWQNGNLNGNNTRYPEGGIVPFRLAIEGLKAGAHTITIQYDFTAGGHKAYDFLATYTGWVSPSMCGGGGGGVSSMCPSMPGQQLCRLPVRRVLDRRSDGPRCRGLFGRLATADHLGRDDRVHQRSQPMPVRPRATAPRSSPSISARAGRPFSCPGVVTWRSPATGTSPPGASATARARCRVRRGTCARCNSTGRGTRTRTEASSRAPSSVSWGRVPLRPRGRRRRLWRHRERRPPARARPDTEGGHAGASNGDRGWHHDDGPPSDGSADIDRRDHAGGDRRRHGASPRPDAAARRWARVGSLLEVAITARRLT